MASAARDAFNLQSEPKRIVSLVALGRVVTDQRLLEVGSLPFRASAHCVVRHVDSGETTASRPLVVLFV